MENRQLEKHTTQLCNHTAGEREKLYLDPAERNIIKWQSSKSGELPSPEMMLQS